MGLAPALSAKTQARGRVGGRPVRGGRSYDKRPAFGRARSLLNLAARVDVPADLASLLAAPDRPREPPTRPVRDDVAVELPDGVHQLTKRHYDEIVTNLPAYWGDRGDSAVMRYAHHPMLLHQFGNSAWVVPEHGAVAAYLVGLRSQRQPTGYVQLVAVHARHRRRGLARRLYAVFET